MALDSAFWSGWPTTLLARPVQLGALLCLSLTLQPPVHAGEVLDAVKARGVLRCGVSEGIPGFSEQDAGGRWRGLDADFCRAVAAAVVGDPDRVQFVPLRASTRFPALQARRIDLLVRNTTWTLTREAMLKVQFPAVLFFDGQGFLVPAGSGITAAEQLQGATVCVEKGTTHERNLRDYFGARGLAVTPLVIDSAGEVAQAFFAGRCRAYTSDASQLAAMRLRAPEGPQAFTILPERISREPLAPAVWGGDPEWASVVRWVLYGLILAEEHGATRDTVDTVLAGGRTPLSRLTGAERDVLARALDLPPGWGLRAVKAVGNYGELYDRNVGAGSPLGIDRGLNRLWSQGGLMYAPPID
jgi:general L-amino acid transport system substrate-binding protein